MYYVVIEKHAVKRETASLTTICIFASNLSRRSIRFVPAYDFQPSNVSFFTRDDGNAFDIVKRLGTRKVPVYVLCRLQSIREKKQYISEMYCRISEIWSLNLSDLGFYAICRDLDISRMFPLECRPN